MITNDELYQKITQKLNLIVIIFLACDKYSTTVTLS